MGGDPPLDDSDFLETRSRFLASCRSGSVVSPLDVSPSLLGEESLQGFRDEESRLLEFLVQWQAAIYGTAPPSVAIDPGCNE